MSGQKTLWDSLAATSSAEFVDGNAPSSLPDGPTTGESCGPPHAPASPSRRRARGSASPTSDTSGQHSSTSSASASLQRSLASRLAALLDTDGSMEYSLTWRERVTPARRRICRLHARGRPTSASGSSGPLGGWPMPNAQEGDTDPETWARRRGRKAMVGINLHLQLSTVAQLAGWQTPRSADHKGAMTESETTRRRAATGEANLPEQVISLVGWGTPSARDSKDAGPAFEADSSIVEVGGRLPRQAALVGWPTPCTPNGGRNGLRTEQGREGGFRHLEAVPKVVSGTPSTSSPVGTGRSGVLNPAHSRWLMGFGETWDRCAPGWMEWDSVQRKLGESSDDPEAYWRWLVKIALGGSEVMGTPSSPR